MKAFGKTMEILNGIPVGLENIRITVYLPRHIGGSLQQKVIVTVHTSYQATSKFRGIERIHQHHFLALCHGCFASGLGALNDKVTFK